MLRRLKTESWTTHPRQGGPAPELFGAGGAAGPARPDAGREAAGDQPQVPEGTPMTFEQALAELERIVQDLERGQLDLEAAIVAYERGTALKEHCERKLKEAEVTREEQKQRKGLHVPARSLSRTACPPASRAVHA